MNPTPTIDKEPKRQYKVLTIIDFTLLYLQFKGEHKIRSPLNFYKISKLALYKDSLNAFAILAVATIIAIFSFGLILLNTTTCIY